jgi:orotate phosphoribosyltransferase
MKKFNEQKFNQFVIENKVIGFFEKPVLLKSKRESHFYINWRNVLEDVWLTDKLLDFVLNFVEDLKLKVDCFLGIPEGATKLGILVQYKFAKKSKNFKKGKFVLPMIRAKKKNMEWKKIDIFLGCQEGK